MLGYSKWRQRWRPRGPAPGSRATSGATASSQVSWPTLATSRRAAWRFATTGAGKRAVVVMPTRPDSTAPTSSGRQNCQPATQPGRGCPLQRMDRQRSPGTWPIGPDARSGGEGPAAHARRDPCRASLRFNWALPGSPWVIMGAGAGHWRQDAVMRDTELYRQLLGLEPPWEVSRVELSVKDGRVAVWAGHPRGIRWTCPECDHELPTYDHAEERSWRHLDSCGFSTHLHARPPRVECP